jgi:transcriptional regulator with XRE-family HTH domain
MRLHELLPRLSAEQRQQLASNCGTSVNYLYQLAGGHRTPSLTLASLIATATQGKVPVSSWVSADKQPCRKSSRKAA